MNRTTPRFGWFDGLILGLAIASGVWAASVDLKTVEATLGLPDTMAQEEARTKQLIAITPNYRPPPTVARLERARRAIVSVGEVLLPCLTIGITLATFRHRECWSRRSLRHVGVLTSAIAGVFVAFLFGSELAFRWTFPFGYRSSHFPLSFSLSFQLSNYVSLPITALWGVLALGGRWKATPEWSDRLGRAIGVAWVVYALLDVLLMYAGTVIYRADGSSV